MIRTVYLATAVVTLLAARANAQQLTVAQRVPVLLQADSANTAALHKYTWLESTNVTVNGEVKATKVESCEYATEGASTPECTVISQTNEKPSGGFFRRRAAERRIKEMNAYMDSVKVLMEMYIPASGPKILQAANVGNISVAKNPSNSTAKVVISSYAQQGDAVTLIVTDPTENLQSGSIKTWLNDPSHAVTLHVTFARLPDRTTYPQTKVLAAKDKGIVITTTMSNFAMAIGSAPSE
jgi:hypothetical protein